MRNQNVELGDAIDDQVRASHNKSLLAARLGTVFVSPVIVTTATISMGSTCRRAMADLSGITWVRV